MSSVEKDIQSQVEETVAALDRVRSEWLARSGVTGVDVGFLWEHGVMTDRVGIRVKVEKLLAPEDVPEGELFPRYLASFRVQVLEEAAPEPQDAEREPPEVVPGEVELGLSEATDEEGIVHAEEASTNTN